MRYIEREAQEIINFWNLFREKVAIHLRRIFAVQIIPTDKIKRRLTTRILYGILLPLALYLFIEIFKALPFADLSLVNYYNISAVYLTLIVISALVFGLVTGLVSAILSFAIIHFLCFYQISTFNLSNSSIVVNFLLLIAISLVASIASYVNYFNKRENLTKDRALRAINRISRATIAISSMNDLAKMICRKMAEDFGGEFWIVLKEGDSGSQPSKIYDKKIAQVLQTMLPSTIYKSNKTIYFKPMATLDRDIGVLVAEINSRGGDALSLGRVLLVLSDQIAIMIDNFEARIRLHEARINEEREKLRSLILSSISHDLKTPLSSIIGGLSVFRALSNQNKLNKENTEILITTALEESERLHSFISDVLEMTRIESGAIKLDKKPLNPFLIVAKILARFEKQLQEYQMEIALDQKIKINFDQIALEQIIQNLVDNTKKY